jgi:hypothetical protein
MVIWGFRRERSSLAVVIPLGIESSLHRLLYLHLFIRVAGENGSQLHTAVFANAWRSSHD